MPTLPLASASLGGRCRQGQSWPAVPENWYGGLSGWNLLLSYMSWRLWTWFLTSSPSFSLSLSVLLSVNCWRPMDNIGERYLREYPKHFDLVKKPRVQVPIWDAWFQLCPALFPPVSEEHSFGRDLIHLEVDSSKQMWRFCVAMLTLALLTADSSKLSFYTQTCCLMVVRWLLYFQLYMHIPDMMGEKMTGYEIGMYQLSLLS